MWMLILQALSAGSTLMRTLLWPSQDQDGTFFVQDVQLHGLLNCNHGCLSITEAEYIALSNALCNVIPIMELVKEMKSPKVDVISILPYVYYKAFEDNSGAITGPSSQDELKDQAHCCLLPSF